MSSNQLLSLVDLVAGYPGNVLFEKLNLSLKTGSLVCLLGANGAGKSTLIKTIGGLQKPLTGNVWPSPPGTSTPASIAVVLTDPVRVANMTVRELITYGRYPYLNWNIRLLPQDEVVIEQSMVQVNIHELAHRKIDELSDGQRQMAMIARALAQNTPVLLLDEPTSHLDLPSRVTIMRFLKQLSRTSQKAILVATHEIELAVQVADVLWLAHEKKIVEGIPEDMMLEGILEKVFPIKGYSLADGKIAHVLHKKSIVAVAGGDDHSRRWTMHALARNGFRVSEGGDIQVTINTGPPMSWTFDHSTVDSLHGLINALNTKAGY